MTLIFTHGQNGLPTYANIVEKCISLRNYVVPGGMDHFISVFRSNIYNLLYG